MECKDPEGDKLVGLDIGLGEAIAQRLCLRVAWQETSFEQMLACSPLAGSTSCCRA